MIVASSCRGQGYGSQGLRLLCQTAAANGISVLRDDIAIDNPAVCLFRKAGFSEEYRTGLPLYYLDLLHHKPDRTTLCRDEFDQKLSEILETNQWIIDGNYRRTLALRFERCTEVFLFDLPVEECLEGAASRIGKVREDMPWMEQEFDPEFRQYILDFQKDQMPRINGLIDQYRDSRKITVFYSREEADVYLKNPLKMQQKL